ncbi:MAG: FAD-dependent oxidoreductase [Pseudomonadota bacterium]
MRHRETDIVIAGGGIAGMTAAMVFAQRGFDVVCVEPAAAGPGTPTTDADLRSTAFLEPAIDLMSEAGLWARLAPHGTDLRVMRLADAGGPQPEVRETSDFDAAELGRDRFGVNLPNWVIRTEMRDAVVATPGIDLIAGHRVVRTTARTDQMIAVLSDGQQIRARLAIAADGRDSALRAGAGIGVRRWDYGQRALVFAVSHPIAHQNVSTEIHRTGGPFTLVPLPDRDGVPHSAVVWMETGPKAAALAKMDARTFEAELDLRSCGVLGPLHLASPRASWPIISQIADRFNAPRLALVAEAAHVMPPIGAQGLNTSLEDLRQLRDMLSTARASGLDIGAPSLLSRYHRARHADTLARVIGIDVLNRAAMSEPPALRDLRRMGLRVLSRTVPLRRTAMRMGLGQAAMGRR